MSFLDNGYLLETETSRYIYSEIRDLPILDPHSHVDVREIVENKGWKDIWEVEAETDHYVWSLMRKRGVSEEKITGDAPNRDKWLALAEIFPKFAGNPTYEWIHLDLKRRFGIEEPISKKTGEDIWEKTSSMLNEGDLYPQSLLEEMNIETICSTDDPISDLKYHEIAGEKLKNVEVLPTWRPDRAMKIEDDTWSDFVEELEEATDINTSDLEGFLNALECTHEYFNEHGCVASDLGIKKPISRPVKRKKAENIYETALEGKNLTKDEVDDFRAYMLEKFGEFNRKTNWVTQLHVGGVRNYRSKLYEEVGPDSGGDISTQNIHLDKCLRHFLNKFDEEIEIVLYCLDPSHLPTIATISRAFPNVSIGISWWFNDSPFGMETHLNYVGTVDLLANCAGMVSDSRKLISYGSRFEMFRRSLSNVVGRMVERKQVPLQVARDLAEYVSCDRPRTLFGFR